MSSKSKASLFVELKGDIGHLTASMDQASKSVRETSEKIEKSNKKIDESYKEVEKSNKKVSESVGEVSKKIEQSNKKIEQSNKQIAKSFKNSFTEINSQISLIGKGFEKFNQGINAIQAGDKLLAVENSFKKLQEAAGRDATIALKELSDATLGTVSNFDLMTKANAAVALGLPIEELGLMAEAATKLGRSVGRDATEAFDDLVKGMGRGSVEVLDNLGIIVSATTAQENYAASIGKTANQLTEAEKKLAFRAEALNKIKEAAEGAADAEENAGLTATRITKSFENLFAEFQKGIAGSDDLNSSLNGLNDLLNSLEVQELARDLGELAASLISLAVDITGPVVWAFEKLQSVIDPIADSIATLIVEAQRTEYITAKKGPRLSTEDAIQQVLNADKKTDAIEKTVSAITKENVAVSNSIKTGEKAANTTKKLANEKLRLSEEWENLNKQIQQDSLVSALDKSIESLNSTSFENLKYELESSVYESSYAGLKKMLNAGVVSTQQAEMYSVRMAETAGKEWQSKMDDATSEYKSDMDRAIQENAEYLQQKQQESYENSIQVFRGLFQDSINPISLDIEDSLSRLAIGFGAELAASTGDGIVEGIGSLEDLGGVLADKLGIADLFSNLFSPGDFDYGDSQGFQGPGGDPSGSGLGQAPTGDGASAQAGISVFMQSLGAFLNAKEKDKQSGSYAGTGGAVGSVGGGTLGAIFGGPQGAVIGAQLGQIGGEFLGGLLGGKSKNAGEKARNGFEDWIETQLKELGTVGFFNNQGSLEVSKGSAFDFVKGDGKKFNEDWGTAFNEIDAQGKNVFSGLGLAIGEFLDLSTDESAQFGSMLVDNFGGSIDNMRLLVMQAGLSLEELETGLVNVGRSGEKSWHEIEVSLQGLNQAFEPGLAAVADLKGAYDELINSGGRGIPALKAIKDIAQEAKEAGATTLEELKQKALDAGVSDEIANATMQAFEQRGLDSLEAVASASDRVLGGVVADIQSSSKIMSDKWAEIGAQLDDITSKLEAMPKEIESNVNINVTSTFSDEAKSAIEAINKGDTNIEVPEVGFAKGGIISSRQRFVAGESGKEAILPLRQMSNGNLGVASAGGGDRQGMVLNIDARGASLGVEQAIRREIEAMGDYAISRAVDIVVSEMGRARY